MKLMFRATTAILGLAVFTALFAPKAKAGCGSYDPRQPWFGQMDLPSAAGHGEPDHSLSACDSIGGIWKVTFISKNNLSHNSPIPDGAISDSHTASGTLTELSFLTLVRVLRRHRITA